MRYSAMRNIRDVELQHDVAEFRSVCLQMGRKRPLRDPIATALEELRFTPAQIHTLLWLGEDGALTMGELASRSGTTEKTITGVVDRLEADHFVHRVRSLEDRRVIRVELTPKGLTVHRRFHKSLGHKLQRMLSLLNVSERRAFIRILKKILTRLD